MRILFLIRSLGRGGAERQIIALANGLATRGHEVHLATFYPNGELEPEVDSAVHRHCLRKRGRYDIALFLYRLRALVKELRPDILHSFMPTSNVLAVLATWGLRCRIVWGIRASNIDYSRYEYSWTGSVLESLAGLLSGYPSLIVSNSLGGHQLILSRGYPKDKSIVIPNGIDTDRFKPREAERERLRQEFRFGGHQMVIGVIARIDPMKGHSVFIKSFRKVLEALPEARAIVVGNGSEHFVQELITLRTNANVEHAVAIIRDCHDTSKLLPIFDLIVSSSIFGEGFSNSIGEAMACGIPCIVSDVGDSAYIVGDSGIVVPPNSPDALAAAIISFSSESAAIRKARGELALQRVADNFSLANLLNRSEAAYHSIIPERN